MNDPQQLVDRLSAILQRSTVRFADIAAGDSSGLRLSIQHTRQESSDDSVVVVDASQRPNRRYLIASITKPIVGMLAVQMAADGKLSLNDPVRDFVEGFHRGPFRNITIRHLLTHTSGLPDMLPNNNELRANHATLDEFVHHTTWSNPEFSPGTDCRYSSMGFAVLAAILEKLDGRPVAVQLHQQVFDPLDMTESWLGLPAAEVDELLPSTLPCELPIWQTDGGSHWNWNSAYWRTLGAPWGGMISTARDLGAFAASILRTHKHSSENDIFLPAVVRECLSNQTMHFAGLTERDRSIRPWSYGWRFNWKDHSASFGDFVSPAAIGHWGATGTLMWIEPQSDRWFVMLTTQPWEQSQSVIQTASNVVATAVMR